MDFESRDTSDLLKTIEAHVKKQPVDLIIIDAFADVFDDEINSNTKVRKFLMDYHRLAIKNKCLIVFLHHLAKRSESITPSKNNIIGSQGFEAKMRSIVEIKKERNNSHFLILLKCNFLPNSEKEIKHELVFDEASLTFSKTKRTFSLRAIGKSSNPEILEKIRDLRKDGKSYRLIEYQLKQSGTPIGKSTIQSICKQHGIK